MFTKRHFIFNLIIIVIPWLSLFIVGKRNVKRFAFAGIFIVLVDLIDHAIGKKRKWWRFYNKSKSFFVNEVPIVIGLYLPVSIWTLTLTYGEFKKFVKLNAIADAIFTFSIMKVLKKYKIVTLQRLNSVEFLIFIHVKAYLLYLVQYVVENWRDWYEKVLSWR